MSSEGKPGWVFNDPTKPPKACRWCKRKFVNIVNRLGSKFLLCPSCDQTPANSRQT